MASSTPNEDPLVKEWKRTRKCAYCGTNDNTNACKLNQFSDFHVWMTDPPTQEDILRAQLSRAHKEIEEAHALLDKNNIPRLIGTNDPDFPATVAERVQRFVREWREATMLDNQEDAAPHNLRQWIQDLADERDRATRQMQEAERVSGVLRLEAEAAILKLDRAQLTLERTRQDHDQTKQDLERMRRQEQFFVDKGRENIAQLQAKLSSTTTVLRYVRRIFEWERQYRMNDWVLAIQGIDAALSGQPLPHAFALIEGHQPVKVAFFADTADGGMCAGFQPWRPDGKYVGREPTEHVIDVVELRTWNEARRHHNFLRDFDPDDGVEENDEPLVQR